MPLSSMAAAGGLSFGLKSSHRPVSITDQVRWEQWLDGKNPDSCAIYVPRWQPSTHSLDQWLLRRARKSTPRLKNVAASPLSAMIPGKAESYPTAIVTSSSHLISTKRIHATVWIGACAVQMTWLSGLKNRHFTSVSVQKFGQSPRECKLFGQISLFFTALTCQ